MSTVFRVEKTANYTVMSNTHLKDRRLSYKSKGLLSVILSLPPDWDYTITGLAVIAADGVDSVKTAIKELEQYGYVTRTQLRDERGRMARNEYRVYENPTDNPDYVSPEQDAPDENAAERKPNSSAPKIKRKRNFSVCPSAENPSTVTPTTDNSQADTIEKLNINILNTDKSIHSFTPAQAQEREDRITDIIAAVKKQGYSVYIHFNELDRNKALGRMINRFLETGRYIKPELVTKYGNGISATYETLKNRSELVDGFSKWNNDVPLGCRPKLIEYSGSCEDLATALKPTLTERLQQAETNCRVLRAKIDEVNDILRENPDLSQMYVQRRNEHRQSKGLTHKPKPPHK